LARKAVDVPNKPTPVVMINTSTTRPLLGLSLMATRSGLDETRRALKALRASPIEDLGLLLALLKLSESAAERGNLHLEMELPENIPLLPPDVEQCIYWVAQEAIEISQGFGNLQDCQQAG
jgi:signal transduction histidine kinase